MTTVEQAATLNFDGGHARSECPQCKQPIYIPNTSRGKFMFPCQHGSPHKDCPESREITKAGSYAPNSDKKGRN